MRSQYRIIPTSHMLVNNSVGRAWVTRPICVNTRGNCVLVFGYAISGSNESCWASDREFVPTRSFIISDKNNGKKLGRGLVDQSITTRTVNLGQVSSNSNSANILSDVWIRSFVFHKWDNNNLRPYCKNMNVHIIIERLLVLTGRNL